jgi:DNA polymerase-1
MKVIVDSSSLCYKAKFTMGDLSYEEKKVGVIFGFFKQLFTLAKENETTEIAFAWDSPKSHRQKLFPAYKEKRRTQKGEKTPEEIEDDKAAYEQFDLLYEEILPLLGVKNNYKIEGFEADDIIASLVFYNHGSFFTIASSDEDMYQLLSPDVRMQKGKKIYTDKDFVKEYGIFPSDWACVKALAGCKSDEVPGIRGVGEATAIKYLNDELTPNLKTYQNIRCPEGKEIYNRNVKLVSLPFKGTPELKFQEQLSYSFDGFLKICQMYDFQWFLQKENLTNWKKVLNLK